MNPLESLRRRLDHLRGRQGEGEWVRFYQETGIGKTSFLVLLALMAAKQKRSEVSLVERVRLAFKGGEFMLSPKGDPTQVRVPKEGPVYWQPLGFRDFGKDARALFLVVEQGWVEETFQLKGKPQFTQRLGFMYTMLQAGLNARDQWQDNYRFVSLEELKRATAPDDPRLDSISALETMNELLFSREIPLNLYDFQRSLR